MKDIIIIMSLLIFIASMSIAMYRDISAIMYFIVGCVSIAGALFLLVCSPLIISTENADREQLKKDITYYIQERDITDGDELKVALSSDKVNVKDISASTKVKDGFCKVNIECTVGTDFTKQEVEMTMEVPYKKEAE